MYKGYIRTKNKKATEKIKGREDFKSYEDVQDLSEFAGVLAEDVILVDIDDMEESEILMEIMVDMEIPGIVYETTRGKHFMFQNDGSITRNGNGVNLPIGLQADIKVGTKNSYQILKYDGQEREMIYDNGFTVIPTWLHPVKAVPEFLAMREGDGRNEELYKYILSLNREGFSKDESREILEIINRFVIEDPLPNKELEVIMRDDAFPKETFFEKNKFLHDSFSQFLIKTYHIKRINGALHIYRDGIYISGYPFLEKVMIKHLPGLTQRQRQEVLKYLEVVLLENTKYDNGRYIGFKNGIYDIRTKKLLDYSPNIIVLNKIPHNYNSNAYSEDLDLMLWKIACDVESIRSLLEEVIGYCFLTANTYQKSVILTGMGANGKSTFLKILSLVLGTENISSLDLSELGDRFKTVMIFGKLANIGDDISDEYISNTSYFKKITTGERISAERKGQDAFDFTPYTKLLYSSNTIPRMGRGADTEALKRRLIIVPFNAKFSKEDLDYDPNILEKVTTKETLEYMVVLGVAALHRIIKQKGFTTGKEMEEKLKEYEIENNPLMAFVDDVGEERIHNKATGDVYKNYTVFCAENNLHPLSKIGFSRGLVSTGEYKTRVKKINGKTFNMFEKL